MRRSDKLKIIFFGLGSIGKRHANLISKHFNCELYAFRSDKKSKRNELGMKEIYGLRDIDKIRPDIAFITNPTNEHIKYAIFCAKKGIDLFIEKPLSDKNKDLAEFRKVLKKNKTSMYVAYCLRFHPVIKWLKKYLENKKPFHVSVYTSSYLPHWRKGINHLKSYSAFKKMGGGAILDLSHELDYLYYLFGEITKIKARAKKLSDVTVDAEDFADIWFEFENKICCNAHINFFSRLNRREIVLDFKENTIIGDLVENKIRIIDDKGIKEKKFKFERDDMYLDQLTYFFKTRNARKNIRDRDKKMMNGIEEAIRVFEIIMKVKRGAAQ